MKPYQVMFHFGNGHSANCVVNGRNEGDVLNNVLQKDRFILQKKNVLHQISLQTVMYITVSELQ